MRGMRQASNRAAKTAISFQCWVQESERGTSASWTAFISTGSTTTHTHTHYTLLLNTNQDYCDQLEWQRFDSLLVLLPSPSFIHSFLYLLHVE